MNKWLLVLLISLSLPQSGRAALTTRIVRDSLFVPWEVAYAPDNHVWFTQRNGYVCRLHPTTRKIDTLLFLNTDYFLGTGGLLGLALHPNFLDTPQVFVAYTQNPGSNHFFYVARYDFDLTSLSLINQTPILNGIPVWTERVGGRLITVGNYLFVTIGDNGDPSSVQQVGSYTGKIIRLNLDGSIPSDNPLFGSPVWSWGFRNSLGLVFAKNTLYSTDQGATEDEINIINKHGNYGWSSVEGFCDLPAEVAFCSDSVINVPIFGWKPKIGIAGLDYYDYTLNMLPALKGSLIATAQGDSILYELEMAQGSVDSITNVVPVFGGAYGRLQDLCVSPSGSIFVSTCNSSATGQPVDKIIEVYDPVFANVATIDLPLQWTVYPNPVGDQMTLQPPTDGVSNAKLSYVVIAADGRSLLSGSLKAGRPTIPTATLPAGPYVVVVGTEEGQRAIIRFHKK